MALFGGLSQENFGGLVIFPSELEDLNMTDDEVKKREQHFATLKSKYQVRSDYEDSSPSSPLYFILRKADLGIELLEFELHWLKEHKLHQTSQLILQKRVRSSGELLRLGRAREYQQMKVEFSNLKSKYEATHYILRWQTSPLYFILCKLDSGYPPTDSEMRWLTDNHFTETLAIAKNSHFVALKAKYQASQYQDSSLSSPLYPILTRLEAKERLSDEQVSWLKSNELFETLAFFQQQESVREALFAKLKDKYQATQHSASSVSSPLYQILRNLDASRPLNVSERAWLKEHDLIETLELAQEIELKLHFSDLKKKYKATQFEDFSPSSHLYKVLKKLDSEPPPLSQSDLNFLRKRKLTETLALAVDKYAASLKSKVKSGTSLSEAEIEWLKQMGRQDIIMFLQGLKHFASLISKYHVSHYQDKPPSICSQLYAILKNLDKGKRLELIDVAWLTGEKLFYPESKIFTTYYQIEATFYEQEYKRTGNKWNLPSASSHWRSAKEPKHALTLTENLNFDNIKENKLKSALLTTRGGAFRDIDDLDEAETCARQAIKYQPSSHHPYTLMGAICFERGEYDEGNRWFNKAIKRGASPRDQDAEIKRVLKNADEEKRREVVEYLLEKDPVRYKWAKKYRDQDAEIKRVLKNADEEKRREVVEYLLEKDPVRYKWAKKYLVDKQPPSKL